MTVQQLLSLLTATILSSISVVAWAYDKFETKEASVERIVRIESRLDRIENKIDRILERAPNRE